jgi:uncharacterized protein YutE (UPF0331/DUF86 family)
VIDRETICRRLHALEAYTAELRRLAASLSRSDFDADRSRQWAVEHGLQLAIECALDVGSHLVTVERLGAPQSYREVIELLGQAGILPPEFVARIRAMPGLRNVLVHDYLTVDLDVVWRMLHDGPADFEEFIRHVAAHLRPRSTS